MNEPEVDANNFVQLLEMLHRHLNKQTNKQTKRNKETKRNKQTNEQKQNFSFSFARNRSLMSYAGE